MGDKRKNLVRKFGYDTKNASHLIRLLRMLIEFLVEGKLNVYRHDASDLVSIKQGEWTIEKVKEEADRLFKLAQEAFVRSAVSNEPDEGGAERLLTDILRARFVGTE